MTTSFSDRAGDLSHGRRWQAGVVQSVSSPVEVDLGRGYLEPGLLPVDLVREAYLRALPEFGSAALTYGDNQGATVLRGALAARAAGESPCGPEHVVVTAGTSHGLHLLATGLATPGELVLVEQKSYDLGRRLFADCGLCVREVPMDDSGMEPQALHDVLVAERGRGTGIGFVYLIPTFHNPTGRVVPVSRRLELLKVAARHEVLIVEDDAYAELGFDPSSQVPSMAGLAGYQGVIRLCSFSKTLGPGLRLGWLFADPAVTERLVSHGVFQSGGSPNHLASLAVATLLRTGDYDRHVDWLRARLLARRDALAGALSERLGDTVEFGLPAGGYFLWLILRAYGETELVMAANQVGIAVAPGSRFGPGGPPGLRLAYSFNSPDRLAAAVAALAGALTLERT